MRARTRTGTADDIALEVELAKGSHTRKLFVMQQLLPLMPGAQQRWCILRGRECTLIMGSSAASWLMSTLAPPETENM